jgi:hypothetical protein
MSKQLNYVMLFHHVIDTPAWHAMSHGARLLYIALRRKWNHHRKNLVYLSERQAAKELDSQRDQIRQWFRELIYYGFIVMERPAYLGVSGKGNAPHYRLTECQTFALKDSLAPIVQATRDFDKWNGIPFKAAGGFFGRPKRRLSRVASPQLASIESRTGKHVHPGRENTSTSGPENTSTQALKWTGKHVHTERRSGPENTSISINHLGRAGRDLSEGEAATAQKLPWAAPHLIEITDPEELRRIRGRTDATMNINTVGCSLADLSDEYQERAARERKNIQREKDIEWLRERMGAEKDPWIQAQIAKLKSEILDARAS